MQVVRIETNGAIVVKYMGSEQNLNYTIKIA